MLPCIATNFLITKPTRCTSFPNLLRHETLHVSGSFSAHHQEFIHCTLGTGMKSALEQDKDGVPSCSCSKTAFKLVWHIPVPSVQWINSWLWTEELPETCRVSCWSKFGKLVHLVDFITKKLKDISTSLKKQYNTTYIFRIKSESPHFIWRRTNNRRFFHNLTLQCFARCSVTIKYPLIFTTPASDIVFGLCEFLPPCTAFYFTPVHNHKTSDCSLSLE